MLKLFSILSHLNRIHARADDWHAGIRQSPRQIQRRLTAELNDHAVRLHAIADI
jgi:hypothetical protein